MHPAARPAALPRLACAFAAALALMSGALSAREITGSLAYRLRMALPSDALLGLDLVGPSGTTLQRLPTRGAQVPLPFALQTEETGAMTLRSAVFLDGRALWIGQPVPLPEGAEDIDLGVIDLVPHLALGPDTRLDCGGTAIALRVSEDAATLETAGTSAEMKRMPASNGRRYSDGKMPETALRIRPDTLAVTLRGKTLPDCTPQIPAPLLPLVARGTEPFWSLTLTPQDIRLETPDAAPVSQPLPAAESEEGKLRFSADGLTVLLEARLCHDAMTGMPYPVTATLTRDTALTGCGGDPAALLAGTWQAREIGGRPLRGNATATLSFADGKITGEACNRFFGAYELTGEGIAFGSAAATRMACAPPQMEAETALFAALSTATRFDIDDGGNLVLLAPDGEALLKASR